MSRTLPPSAITKVTCPKCFPDAVPGQELPPPDPHCPLCEGVGMVTKYVDHIYRTRRMSGEYHGVSPR